MRYLSLPQRCGWRCRLGVTLCFWTSGSRRFERIVVMSSSRSVTPTWFWYHLCHRRQWIDSCSWNFFWTSRLKMIAVDAFVHMRYITHPSSDISTCDRSNEVTQCVDKPRNFSAPVWEFRRCKPKASLLVSPSLYGQVTGEGRGLDRRLQFRGVLNFQMPFELLNISSEELIGIGAARRSCLLCVTWPVLSGNSIVLHHNHWLEQSWL